MDNSNKKLQLQHNSKNKINVSNVDGSNKLEGGLEAEKSPTVTSIPATSTISTSGNSTKDWHSSITSNDRNDSVHCLIEALYPTCDSDTMMDTHNLDSYAQEVERDVYERANSRSEYFHLLTEVSSKIIQDLKEKINNLNTHAQAIQQKNEILYKKYEISREENMVLRQKNKVSSNKNEILRQEIHISRKENEILCKKNVILRTKCKILRKENKILHKECEILCQKNEILRKENNMLRKVTSPTSDQGVESDFVRNEDGDNRSISCSAVAVEGTSLNDEDADINSEGA